MAAVPLLLTVASAGMSILSAVQQGQVASANAKSSANIAGYNQKVAENNAVATRQQAVANEESQRRSASIQMGRARASIAESGAGADGADLYGQGLATAELDAKNILYAGDLKGQGLDSEAYMQGQAKQTYSSNAKAASNGIFLNAAGSVLSSFGNYTRGASLSKGAG